MWSVDYSGKIMLMMRSLSMRALLENLHMREIGITEL